MTLTCSRSYNPSNTHSHADHIKKSECITENRYHLFSAVFVFHGVISPKVMPWSLRSVTHMELSRMKIAMNQLHISRM